MKKLLLILFLVLPFSSQAKLKIVTTTSDLASLAREVGGELVEVESLARGDQDAHYLEPKPSFAILLNQADLLIEVGLELESGWLPVLLVQSRNPGVQSGQPGHLIAAEGVNILEIPTGPIDRSQGDVHPSGNPHYWLDPGNGLMIARNIATRLSTLDPKNAPHYQGRLKNFENMLTQKISLWQKETAAFRGKSVVTYHKTFSYFADWAGLNVVGFIEPKPGIPPSPAHILSLIRLIKTGKVLLILMENFQDSKPSNKISGETGTRVISLPTSVGGEPSVMTYPLLFDHLIAKIREAP